MTKPNITQQQDDTGITKGKWNVVEVHGSDSVRIFSGDTFLGWVGNSDHERQETLANANFIVEAANIAHETGKTPAQLREERDELLAALQAVLVMWKSPEPRKFDDALTWRDNDEKAEAMARAAIAKATGMSNESEASDDQ